MTTAQADGTPTAETECPVCGDDYSEAKIRSRKARGLDCCLQCALDTNQPLDPEDANDLAEDYWSRREDARS